MAEQAGVNVETLRYYERRGLLPEPSRSNGGHREYGADTVRFVGAVKEAQSLGFSLAEIEEYLRVSRRDPGAAAEAARDRLEGKLEEVDASLAALRARRADLEGALYEVWGPLERSTSNAAYLARGGRDPVLGPLHVTNGESVGSTLRATSLEGVVLSWDDVLHVGPLAFDPKESRTVRARFLAECGWGTEEAIGSELARRDDLLARAERVVLWFEHDLVDQLQLLQVLAQLGGNVEVELVQADHYLRPLEAAALEQLWPSRRPVGREAGSLHDVRGARCARTRSSRGTSPSCRSSRRLSGGYARSALRCRGRSGSCSGRSATARSGRSSSSSRTRRRRKRSSSATRGASYSCGSSPRTGSSRQSFRSPRRAATTTPSSRCRSS